MEVKVDRHDVGGVKVDVIGPRLNNEIDPWSVIVVVDNDVVVAAAIVEKMNVE